VVYISARLSRSLPWADTTEATARAAVEYREKVPFLMCTRGMLGSWPRMSGRVVDLDDADELGLELVKTATLAVLFFTTDFASGISSHDDE
jgi:hypothetical protein